MAKNPILKIGLIGIGKISTQHAEVLRRLKRYKLFGVYDPNVQLGNTFAKENNIQYFSSWKELLEEVDVIDLNIVSEDQYEICQYVVKKAKHIFSVNRIHYDIERASKLLEFVEEAGVVLQFHSKYRFQKQFLHILPYIYFPLFIESLQNLKREEQKNDDYWFEELYNRIQWILSIVNALPKKVHGDTVSIKDFKVVNARLEFDNACVANLTMNGVVPLPKDELNLFHPKLYIQMNLAKNIVKLESFVNPESLNVPKMDQVSFVQSSENTWIAKLNSETDSVESVIEEEMKAFYDAVVFGKKVSIDLSNALQSREVINSIV